MVKFIQEFSNMAESWTVNTKYFFINSTVKIFRKQLAFGK